MVLTVAWCRCTPAEHEIRYSPSTVEPQKPERMLLEQQRSERFCALKLLALSVSLDRGLLLSSKGLARGRDFARQGEARQNKLRA